MLIQTIPISTGRLAIILEKKLHLRLRRLHSSAVLNRTEFGREVRVVSELYCASIETEIMRLLDDVEIWAKAIDRRRARMARRDQRR